MNFSWNCQTKYFCPPLLLQSSVLLSIQISESVPEAAMQQKDSPSACLTDQLYHWIMQILSYSTLWPFTLVIRQSMKLPYRTYVTYFCTWCSWKVCILSYDFYILEFGYFTFYPWLNHCLYCFLQAHHQLLFSFTDVLYIYVAQCTTDF